MFHKLVYTRLWGRQCEKCQQRGGTLWQKLQGEEKVSLELYAIDSELNFQFAANPLHLLRPHYEKE
jgi:hypothetical protein